VQRLLKILEDLLIEETERRKGSKRQGGNRTKQGFDVLWSFSMGSTARPPKNGKRKDGTYAFDLPHPFFNGRMVCDEDPLLLKSHTDFKRKVWVIAGIVLDFLDPAYKEGGWALYASCKDDASEIKWHQDKHDVQYQYWAKLGCFENEFVDFGGSEHDDHTRTFFGSRREGEPYPIVKCDTRGWHRVRKANFKGVSYSLAWFKMYDSTQTCLPPRFWPPVYI